MKLNKLSYLTFVTSLSLLTACSSDIEVIDKNEGVVTECNQITMTVPGFNNGNSDTRSTVNISNSGVNFLWAANDTVGIFPNEGAQAYFPMTNGAGTSSAKFTGGGWALKPSSKYMAYYPLKGEFYLKKDSITVSYQGQTQVGNASTTHVGKYDFMSAVAATPADGNVNFEFQHIGCFVEFNLSLPKKGDISSLTLSSEQEIFIKEGYMNLTQTPIKLNTSSLSKSLTLNVKELSTFKDNENVKLYMMMPPVDMTGKTINVQVVSNGINCNGTVTPKNLIAGNAYKLDVTLETQPETGNVYHVSKAGTLSQLIGEANKNSITDLKLTGELNGDDIKFIREMAGGDVYGRPTNGILMNLNMYDARIVEGGGRYYNCDPDFFTTKDIIGAFMFANCKSLMELILPNNIKGIDVYAFQNCDGLQNIIIPDKVSYISSNAFFECTGLRNIKLPSSLKEISDDCFYRCSGLEEITIPKNVEIIGRYSFEECSSLKKLVLNNGLKKISDGAFELCEGLTSIIVPSTVTSIEGSAFMSCTGLKDIKLSNRIKSINGCTFTCCRSLENIEIPDSVNTICSRAFESCNNLKTITLPNSVRTLGENIFSGSNINILDIKEGLIIMGTNALRDCNARRIILPKTLKQVRSGALSLKSCSEIYCFAEIPPILYSDNIIPSWCKIYVPKQSINKYKSAEGWKEYAANIFEFTGFTDIENIK